MTICIVGHRDIQKDQQRRVRLDIQNCLRYLQSQYGEIIALSLIASGADTIFYEEAKALGISVTVSLPFQLEEYRKDFGGEDLEKFDAIVTAEKPGWVKPLASDAAAERDLAYLNASKSMVDASTFVIAVWDGGPAQGIAGTESLVHYAWDCKKTVIHIQADRSDGNDDSHAIETADSEKLEGLAKTAKLKFRWVWGLGIAFGLLSVFCYVPILFFDTFFEHHHDWMLALAVSELVCLGFSYWLLRYVSNAAKADLIAKRIAAERKRLQDKFQEAGVQFPVDQRHTNDTPPDTPQTLQVKSKLIDFAQDQIVYHYHQRVKKFSNYKRALHKIMDGIVYGFFGVTVLNFAAELIKVFDLTAFKFARFETVVSGFHCLWVILPASYAALEAIIYFKEWQFQIRVSKKIILELEAVKKEVMTADANNLAAVSRELKSVLEIENREWGVLIGSKHIGPYI